MQLKSKTSLLNEQGIQCEIANTIKVKNLELDSQHNGNFEETFYMKRFQNHSLIDLNALAESKDKYSGFFGLYSMITTGNL
jgi:hypothetical protein